METDRGRNLHAIVYLDQNYTSNMAKARCGFMKNKDEAKFWDSLFDDLKRAVFADRIACPESEFHLTEAKYDERLWEPIIEIVRTLSGGLQLRPWKNILESQVKDAARQFLGKQPEKREDWSIAFESDPHSKYMDRVHGIQIGQVRMYIHRPLTRGDIEHERQRKLEFVREAQEMLQEYSRKPLGWPELLLGSKMSVIDGFMGKFAEQNIYKKLKGDYSLEDKLIVANNYIRLKNFWNCIHKVGINPKDYHIVNSFVRSKELLNSPYIDVNASIWAAIGKCYIQGRSVQLGDFYDVPILASAIPYCDIIATEKFMKEVLVNMLDFSNKYKSSIFSASKVDRLAFWKFVRELPNKTK